MKRTAAALLFTILTVQPAIAQSSLGFRTGDASASIAGHAASGGGSNEISEMVGLRGDFAITEAHGLQIDLDYANTGSAQIGTLAGHLYMTPAGGQKYGLFFSFGDFDGVSATVGQFGAEGIFALGDNLNLEARAGIGVRNPGSTDYIFAGIGLSRDVGTSGRLALEFDVADFDEAGFSTTVLDARVAYQHRLRGTPATLSMTLGAVGLDGSGSGMGGAYVGIAVSFRLGPDGTGPSTQLFGRTEPITMLHRIGVF